MRDSILAPSGPDSSTLAADDSPARLNRCEATGADLFLFGALTILGHAAIIHGGDVPPWDWWSLVLVGSWSWAVSIAMKFMPDEGEEEGNGG